MDGEGEALLIEALGWISDIMADDSTRDGEPPSGKEIADWTESWTGRTQQWLHGTKE